MSLIYNILFIRITPGIFRLLLALIVVVYHTVSFLPIGQFSVYVFFILSGYWIFRMYNEKYLKFENPYSTFLKSRIYRIMPVYLLTLVISIIVYLSIPEYRDQLMSSIKGNPQTIFNLSCLGLNFSNYRIIVPAWSLDIEIQFYFIAPVLVYFLTMNTRIKISVLSIIIFSSYITLSIINYIPNTIITYLPFFMIGGIIYKLNFNPSQKISTQFLALAILVLAFNYFIPILSENFLNPKAKIIGYIYSDIINIILAILTIPYIANNVNQKNSTYMRNDPLYASMSFIIYLLHWPILKIYALIINNIDSLFLKSVSLISFYLISIVTSLILSKYFDNYVDAIRRSWLSKQPLLTQS